MYAPFFGLKQEPFSIAPDPRYLFMSERHREALAHLLYGIRGGGGFVLLTGEIGTGKTTVCRCFLEQMPANCNVAYIFNPKLTVIELLQSVCEEFHVAVPPRDLLPPTVKDYLDPLNAFLLRSHAAGQNNVLIIDEAQNLSAEVLEQLRLLTNLETSERKLLQIVLIGQPELRDMVARPELEQLAQRVIARYHLGPLDAVETANYVQHRLEVAGLSRALPFERKALARVHQLSRGVPRRVNLLCDRALLGAYAGNRGSVSAQMVERAAGEVFDDRREAARPWRRAATVVGVGLACGGALLVAARQLELPWASPRAGAEPVIAAAAVATAPAAVPASAGASAAMPAAPASSPGEPMGATAAAEASAAAAAASAPAAPAGDAQPAPPPALLASEAAAWRELAQVWKVELPEGRAPCRALERQQLYCYSRPLSLATIRQLARPGVVTLDAATGQPSYAILSALTDDSATLTAAGTRQTVTLQALAARWQGQFSTLWRVPEGYAGRTADLERGPAVAWATAQLATLDGKPDAESVSTLNAATRERVRSFQLAQGLPATGQLGALTFMQLNRVAGVDEPRLRTAP